MQPYEPVDENCINSIYRTSFFIARLYFLVVPYRSVPVEQGHPENTFYSEVRYTKFFNYDISFVVHTRSSFVLYRRYCLTMILYQYSTGRTVRFTVGSRSRRSRSLSIAVMVNLVGAAKQAGNELNAFPATKVQ